LYEELSGLMVWSCARCSITQGIRTIWQTEGILGFYQGYFSICVRDVPFTMLEMGIYDNLKTLLVRLVTPKGEGATPSAAGRMAAELVAGWCILIDINYNLYPHAPFRIHLSCAYSSVYTHMDVFDGGRVV
jgi:hypothetical protein